MKYLCILLLLFSATAAFAQDEQSGMIKTADGVLIVWNEPGNYFTIEVKGKKIEPMPQPRMFRVDGQVFQIQTTAKSLFLKNPSDKSLTNRAILEAHRDWERDYAADLLKHELKVESEYVELENGMQVLGWGYNMPKVAEEQTAKYQMFLTFVKRDHVIVLNSALEDLADSRDTKSLLLKTLLTLKSSDKPLSLQKASEMVKKGN